MGFLPFYYIILILLEGMLLIVFASILTFCLFSLINSICMAKGMRIKKNPNKILIIYEADVLESRYWRV